MKILKSFFYTAIFMLVLTLLALPALAFPRPGHYFYGTVSINGQPAEPGTKVTAQVAGVAFTTQVGEQGRYGYSPLTLVVRADDLGTIEREGGNDGDPVTFSVCGQPANTYDPATSSWISSYPFESGGLSQLELSIEQNPSSQTTLMLPFVVLGQR